jgi:hypothetical protein
MEVPYALHALKVLHSTQMNAGHAILAHFQQRPILHPAPRVLLGRTVKIVHRQAAQCAPLEHTLAVLLAVQSASNVFIQYLVRHWALLNALISSGKQ